MDSKKVEAKGIELKVAIFFSIRDQRVKIFGVVGYLLSLSLPLLYSMKVAIDSTNEWM